MIKFHYFRWRADFMRLQGLPVAASARGEIRCCHVYSDVSREELLAWGERHSLSASWLHDRVPLPHFDLWGRRLRMCQKPGVRHRIFLADVREAEDRLV